MAVLQAVRVNLDGTAEGVKIEATDSGERFEALYQLIGCAVVEPVGLPGGITLWIDEEGRYRSELNATLTGVVRRTRAHNPLLFGSGVFLGHDDSTGETVGLTLDQLASVVAWWRCVTTNGADPLTARRHLTAV